MSKLNTVDSIRIFGSDNPNVPAPSFSLVSMFSIVANQYMYVPNELLESVVMLLVSKGYVYKTKNFPKYTVFALQFMRV